MHMKIKNNQFPYEILNNDFDNFEETSIKANISLNNKKIIKPVFKMYNALNDDDDSDNNDDSDDNDTNISYSNMNPIDDSDDFYYYNVSLIKKNIYDVKLKKIFYEFCTLQMLYLLFVVTDLYYAYSTCTNDHVKNIKISIKDYMLVSACMTLCSFIINSLIISNATTYYTLKYYLTCNGLFMMYVLLSNAFLLVWNIVGLSIIFQTSNNSKCSNVYTYIYISVICKLMFGIYKICYNLHNEINILHLKFISKMRVYY